MADEVVKEEEGSCPDLLMKLLSAEGGIIDTVDLRSSTFTSSGIRDVMLPLLTNLSARVLYLPIDRLDLVCSKTIAMMTKNNIGPPIEELHLSNLSSVQQIESEMNGETSSMIISSLKHNKYIKKLHIVSEVAVHQSIISSIASILYDNTVLSSLILRGCGISHAGATKIACALASNASITVLDLSNNPLGNGGVCSVALALELNHTIQKLKLSGTNMGREGGEAMVVALAVNKSLEVLDMSRNSLDDLVMTKLSRSLKLNTTLRQLSLRSNSFSSIGALCISFALYNSKNLQALIGCNHTLRYLNIDSNQTSRECVIHTNDSLRWNALKSTENETIREKVLSFLLESESNCLCFRDYFEDATTVLQLMPNVLWSMNENATVLYYLVRNLTVHNISTGRDALAVTKSSFDSVFSADNKCNTSAIDDNKCAIPEFVDVNSND
ncbi:hypothetical protein ACHAXM_011850 [Skeletonema potamos]